MDNDDYVIIVVQAAHALIGREGYAHDMRTIHAACKRLYGDVFPINMLASQLLQVQEKACEILEQEL